ncbi:hypothetical protein Acr_00g0016340 [Actinidia rufa]|uniref:Uncharacterized protein n=1 Tax=Actinidia rufa TaxID=165716 RepID=A0A7J0DAV1_9ERIC|nr:hypothetical protein Acr_00g0016340 [Actinidia rufa]
MVFRTEIRRRGPPSLLYCGSSSSVPALARSCELDVLALWVRFLLGKLRIAIYFSSVCICHSAINVGATCPRLVRLRARLSSCAEILCLIPKAHLVWTRVRTAATFACPMGLVGRLPAQNFHAPTKTCSGYFLASSPSLLGVCLAFILRPCFEFSREF